MPTPLQDSGEFPVPAHVPPGKGIGLALSGGGFRAALFHLGALRRLNELGILSKIDTISSVSGGSILAAHLATRLRPWPEPGSRFPDWTANVEAPFCEFVQRNIRTWPVLRRVLFPWNWPRSGTQVRTLQTYYGRHLTDLMLSDLPERPNFVFCATDMIYGVSWIFERGRVGGWRTGYLQPAPDWPLAMAVAASSCFPPVFSPIPITPEPGRAVVDGRGKPVRRGPGLDGLSVTDGGLYDNLGLQPVERHGTLLVSDGGAPFIPAAPRSRFERWRAYLAINSKQAGAVRKRWLISQYVRNERQGTYWGIVSAVERYRSDARNGYDKELAEDTIARIRTDMDAFSEAEAAILVNHGYLLAEVAVEVHAPHLRCTSAERKTPFPEWMDREKVRQALKDSHQRRWLGRF